MRLLGEFLKFDIHPDNLPLRREQICARLATYPALIFSAMLIVPLLGWMMWDVVAHDVLLGWMMLAFVVQGFELWQWQRHRAAVNDLAQCKHWDWRFRRDTILSASVWGIAWLLMYIPGNLAYQALITCLAIGLAAERLILNLMHRPSLFLDIVFLLAPLIVRLALENDKEHWFLVLTLLVYIGFILNAAPSLAQTFELSLRQSLEREALQHLLHEREEELAQALEKAKQANQAKSKFLAAASHDLRQPLQALRLFSDALQEQAKGQAFMRLVRQINQSVDALVEMFDDLLDVSRLDAGIIEPRWQHFNLVPLLDRLYGEFTPLAQQKGLFYRQSFGQSCQEKSTIVVHSDPFLLERMLRNLITNAIRYTDRGGVEVRCENTQEGVMLSVIDSGIGIRPEVLPHIFEEYYQVGNPHRDRRKGLGLGLAIVRRIDALLHAKLRVSSEPGVGTTFTFEVPHGRASELVEPFQISHSRYHLDGRVVALVEDDPDIREALVDTLQGWGCSVVAAESADTLIRDLDMQGLRPEVLVCDHRLPDGVTAVHLIQRMHELWGHDLPAVVLTGDTASGTLQDIHRTGAVLLHKPVAPIRLRAILHFLLTGRRGD